MWARRCLEALKLTAGTAIIDSTTGEPEAMAAFGEKLREAIVDYLDATVLGSSRVVRSGTAVVMAGGRRTVFDAASPLFKTFASRAFYLGPYGAGARMKLVVNLALGLHRAVLAETLAFAHASRGLARGRARSAEGRRGLFAGDGRKGQKMLDHDFTVEAKLSQHLKDVRLILAAAGAKHAKTPLSQVHRQLLESLEAAGYGEVDNSAI